MKKRAIKNVRQLSQQQTQYMLDKLEAEGFLVSVYTDDEWYAIFEFSHGIELVFGAINGKGGSLGLMIDDREMDLDDYNVNVKFTFDLDDNVRKVLDFRDYYVKNELDDDYALKGSERESRADRDVTQADMRGASVDPNKRRNESMEITKRQLRRIIREVVEEEEINPYGTGNYSYHDEDETEELIGHT